MSSSNQTAQIEIVHIHQKEQLSRFSCGVPELDRWAQNTAFKLHCKGRHKVYVAREVDGYSCLAFYSLSFKHEAQSKLLSQDDRDAWMLGAPFLFLDYIAVVRSMQANGIGTLLLHDALKRARDIHNIAPLYGVALRAINGRAKSFYERTGFCQAPDESRADAPLMILPMLTLLKLWGEG